jgi:hypothetical protein
MRALNRILCLLLAAAIAVAGILTVIEIIAAAFDNDPVVVKWHGLVKDLASNQWKTAGPRAAAVVLILVGLLLLIFALRRGKPATIALTTQVSDLDLTTTRRSLQRSLSTVATSVDGITDATVRVKRRKVVVSARGGSGVPKDDATSRLTRAMQERLDRLSLADARRLKVSVVPAPDTKTPEAPAGLSDSSGSDAGSTGTDQTATDRTPVGATTDRGGSQ